MSRGDTQASAAPVQGYGNLKTASASELRMSVGDKRQLIDRLCADLDIGGWCCGGEGHFDVTDEDLEKEWGELETKLAMWSDPSAYRVGLLLVTTWERENATTG